jgi:hypothetical protein
VHLYCTDTNTVSKRKEEIFPTTHVNKEFYRVRPKWFLSLWHIRRKPWTYVASTLALSPNRPKRASTWASSPSGTVGCIQNDFWAYDTSCANCAPILHWHSLQETFHLLTFSSIYNVTNWVSIMTTCDIYAVVLWQLVTLNLWHYKWMKMSKEERFLVVTIPMSKRNDFWADGTFGGNCALILHRH